VQFIGEELNMNKEKEQDIEIDIKQLYKVVDKLEQRIAKLEKVLESHAKCIGEMREVITDE
jgi:exonuclease VII small subunit